MSDESEPIELDPQLSERVKRRAWEVDRGPDAVLDELVRYALIHYEDALDLHDEEAL